MWMVCWQNNDDVPDGGKCISTLLRDGNYDYYTNEVHWHGIGGTGVNNGLTPPANHTLPASMYLTSKPAFFGSTTWPWVDGSTPATHSRDNSPPERATTPEPPTRCRGRIGSQGPTGPSAQAVDPGGFRFPAIEPYGCSRCRPGPGRRKNRACRSGDV